MTSITFSSSKSWVSALAIWGTTAMLVVLLVQEIQSSMPVAGKITLGAFCVLVSGLLLWLWFGTHYRLSHDTLYYRSGPLHGSIPIQQIREIKVNHHLWSGLRPALGLHGVVVYYGRWDEIYFSPADQESFVQALKQMNPGILVQ